MDLVRKWASEQGAPARFNANPTVCESCGNKTDLGHKCRACYAQWKRNLWADLPKAHAQLLALAKELNKAPDSVRKDIADLVLGFPIQKPLGGPHAQLLTRVWDCIQGPMGGAMEMRMHAIRNATEKTPGKSRGAREETE
jgi:hypothetical protein